MPEATGLRNAQAAGELHVQQATRAIGKQVPNQAADVRVRACNNCCLAVRWLTAQLLWAADRPHALLPPRPLHPSRRQSEIAAEGHNLS